jgi:16S rRNA (guanine966-N2)-methyltransferase
MLRVIGGTLRGRRLATPPGRHTRPTSDKVREAIFSALGALLDLDGARVLDLYAGSGALGIEALSRGAVQCTFVEAHARTAAGIRANLEHLGLSRDVAPVVVARAERWLAAASQPPATLVLADPPYAGTGHDALLDALARSPAVAGGAVIVLETAAGQALAPPSRLELRRTKVYGDTQVAYLIKTTLDVPSVPAGEPSP